MDLWVDEAIWGHRLHDEQLPWLTLLECLGVAYAEFKKDRAFAEPIEHLLKYTPLAQLRLRNVLFNNPKLHLIAQRSANNDGAWSEWEAEIRRSAGGIAVPDFKYLRAHFAQFGDFVSIVEFLRDSAVEGQNNKRWNSKFVFPFGPAALYEDLKVKEGMGGGTNDRRFFARSGELLYLMLCRSGRGHEIREAFAKRFFDSTKPYARLVRAIQGEDEPVGGERGGAYLPYAALDDFRSLADDWLAILNRSLPAYDALPHLVTITGLHLVLYFLRRAHAECAEPSPLTLVMEIVAPERTAVRDLSCDSFAHNNELPRRAVEEHIAAIAKTDAWKAALASSDSSGSAREVLTHEFLWSEDDDDLDTAPPPAELLEKMKRQALRRHEGHVAKIHSTWGRNIGLSSRRAARANRYAPTDSLLKTLVICCVANRMELREFAELLHTKYHFVIGDQQARSYTKTAKVDPETFSENMRRLEERLLSLGLLRRLSDQCAYVENTFAAGST